MTYKPTSIPAPPEPPQRQRPKIRTLTLKITEPELTDMKRLPKEAHNRALESLKRFVGVGPAFGREPQFVWRFKRRPQKYDYAYDLPDSLVSQLLPHWTEQHIGRLLIDLLMNEVEALREQEEKTEAERQQFEVERANLADYKQHEKLVKKPLVPLAVLLRFNEAELQSGLGLKGVKKLRSWLNMHFGAENYLVSTWGGSGYKQVVVRDKATVERAYLHIHPYLAKLPRSPDYWEEASEKNFVDEFNLHRYNLTRSWLGRNWGPEKIRQHLLHENAARNWFESSA